jgi:hypothetical protein
MERLKRIQIEIDKFSKKTKSEKIKFLEDVKEICFYNQELFLSYENNETQLNKVIQFLLN